jgi:ankyrin repeat protein
MISGLVKRFSPKTHLHYLLENINDTDSKSKFLDALQNATPDQLFAVDSKNRNLLHLAAEQKNNPHILSEIIGRINSLQTSPQSETRTLAELLNGLNNLQDSPLHVAAECSDRDTVRLLVENKADLHKQGEAGTHPIHKAAYFGNIPVVEYLTRLREININARDKRGRTPLLLAVLQRNSNIASQLIDLGADVNAQAFEGSTPLSLAIQNFSMTMGGKVTTLRLDTLAIIQKLLQSGANIHYRINGVTLLKAAQNQFIPYAKLQDKNTDIEEKLNPNAPLRSQEQPISLPQDLEAQIGSSDIDFIEPNLVTLILSDDRYGFQLLLCAVQNKQSKNLEKILSAISQKNKKHLPYLLNRLTPEGQTLLHLAVEKNDEKTVGVLLNFKADPSLLNPQNKAPLDLISEKSANTAGEQNAQRNIINTLLRTGAKCHVTPDTFSEFSKSIIKNYREDSNALAEAIRNCDDAKIAEILEKENLTIDSFLLRSDSGYTIEQIRPLHFALKYCRTESLSVVVELLRKHYQLGTQNSDEKGFQDALENVESLLNRPDFPKRAPIHESKILYRLTRAKKQFSVNVSFNPSDDDSIKQVSALHTAALERNIDLISSLDEQGKNNFLNQKFKGGKTPFEIAILKGHAHIVKEIITAWNIPKNSDFYFQIAQTAVEYGHLELLKVVLGHRENNITENSLSLLLNQAVDYGDKDMVLEILKKRNYSFDLPTDAFNKAYADVDFDAKRIGAMLLQFGANPFVNNIIPSEYTKSFIIIQKHIISGIEKNDEKMVTNLLSSPQFYTEKEKFDSPLYSPELFDGDSWNKPIHLVAKYSLPNVFLTIITGLKKHYKIGDEGADIEGFKRAITSANGGGKTIFDIADKRNPQKTGALQRSIENYFTAIQTNPAATFEDLETDLQSILLPHPSAWEEVKSGAAAAAASVTAAAVIVADTVKTKAAELSATVSELRRDYEDEIRTNILNNNIEYFKELSAEKLLQGKALHGLISNWAITEKEIRDSIIKKLKDFNLYKKALSSTDSNSNTPLHLLAELDKDGSIVTELLQELPDDCPALIQRNNDSCTPLHLAAIHGNHSFSSTILKKFPALVNQQCLKQANARTHSTHGHIPIVTANDPTYGWTPLHFAVFYGCDNAIDALLPFCNEESFTKSECRPDKLTPANGENLLLKKEEAFIQTINTLLVTASAQQAQDLNPLTALLNTPPIFLTLPLCWKDGGTALHYAAQTGNSVAFNFILAAIDGKKTTPIHTPAVAQRSSDSSDITLSQKQIAALSTVSTFTKISSIQSSSTAIKVTPLELAIYEGKLIPLLDGLEYSLPPELLKQLLATAIRLGKKEEAEALISKYKASLNIAVDQWEKEISQFLSSAYNDDASQYQQMFGLLVKYGAHPVFTSEPLSLTSENIENALRIAFGDLTEPQKASSRYQFFTKINTIENNLLHGAIKISDESLEKDVAYLIENGVDIDAKNIQAQTPRNHNDSVRKYLQILEKANEKKESEERNAVQQAEKEKAEKKEYDRIRKELRSSLNTRGLSASLSSVVFDKDEIKDVAEKVGDDTDKTDKATEPTSLSSDKALPPQTLLSEASLSFSPKSASVSDDLFADDDEESTSAGKFVSTISTEKKPSIASQTTAIHAFSAKGISSPEKVETTSSNNQVKNNEPQNDFPSLLFEEEALTSTESLPPAEIIRPEPIEPVVTAPVPTTTPAPAATSAPVPATTSAPANPISPQASASSPQPNPNASGVTPSAALKPSTTAIHMQTEEDPKSKPQASHEKSTTLETNESQNTAASDRASSPALESTPDTPPKIQQPAIAQAPPTLTPTATDQTPVTPQKPAEEDAPTSAPTSGTPTPATALTLGVFTTKLTNFFASFVPKQTQTHDAAPEHSVSGSQENLTQKEAVDEQNQNDTLNPLPLKIDRGINETKKTVAEPAPASKKDEDESDTESAISVAAPASELSDDDAESIHSIDDENGDSHPKPTASGSITPVAQKPKQTTPATQAQKQAQELKDGYAKINLLEEYQQFFKDLKKKIEEVKKLTSESQEVESAQKLGNILERAIKALEKKQDPGIYPRQQIEEHETILRVLNEVSDAIQKVKLSQTSPYLIALLVCLSPITLNLALPSQKTVIGGLFETMEYEIDQKKKDLMRSLKEYQGEENRMELEPLSENDLLGITHLKLNFSPFSFSFFKVHLPVLFQKKKKFSIRKISQTLILN